MSIPVRAAIYRRASTPKEAQTTSWEAQLTASLALVQQKEWQLIMSEGDRKTGKFEAGRMGWLKIVAAAQRGEIDVLVVDKRDRVWRNFDDFRAAKKGWMRDYKVRIVPVMGLQVEPGNYWSECAEEDEFLAAERYSRRLGVITKEGQDRRLAAGYWPRFAPFGTKPGSVKGIPEADPDNWPVVVTMFEDASSGASYSAIMRWLIESEIESPRKASWCIESVSRILQSPFYIGECWQQGRVIPLLHKCRIDDATWWSAQAEHIGPKKGGRPRNGGQVDYVWLAPKVICSSYIVTGPKGRAGDALVLAPHYTLGKGGVPYPYYYREDRLKGRRRVSTLRLDDPDWELASSIPADELDELLVDWLIETTRDSEQLRVLLEDGKGRRLVQAAQEEANLRRSLTQQRIQLTRTEGRLLRTDESLTELVRLLNDEALQRRARLAESEAKLASLRTEQQRLTELQVSPAKARKRIHVIKALWEAGEYQELAKLIATIVESVDLGAEGGTVNLLPLMAMVELAAPTRPLAYSEKFRRRIIRAA